MSNTLSQITKSTPVRGMQTSQDPLSEFQQSEIKEGSTSKEIQEKPGQGRDAQIVAREVDNEEDTYHSSSTTNSYRDEWFRLFERDDYLQVVKQEGKKGRLRSSRFRSICWKIYLECLPDDRTTWQKSVRANRKKYDGFREKYIQSTKEGLMDSALDPTLNNPLSQMEESPWNKFFQDKDCRTEIRQDVVRCFPEIAFFKSEKIREMMVDILFCFAKENSHVLYKQGMHELLAPLMFVIHCDQQAFLHAKEMESQLDIVSELMNPEYLEHDSYTLFCHLMETAEPWFHHGHDFPPPQGGFVQSEPFSKPEECNPSSPLVKKLNRIREVILKKHDFELYTHLNRLDIQPQIYGIRWLRLLFGREFTFQDLIVLWDAIFADSPMLDLVDYIFVAMLIKIRELLLTAEYADCLMLLMRYPTVDDIHYLVNKALHLRDPKNNPRQANYQFQIYAQMKTGNVISTTRGNVTVSKKPTPAGGVGVAKKTSSAVSQGFNSLRRIGKGANGTKDKGSKSKTTEDLPHPLAQPSDLVTDIQKRDLKVLTKPSIASMETLSSSTEGLTKVEKQAPVQPKIFTKPRSASKKPDPETEQQLAVLQSRFNELQTLCRYCASKMEAHIFQMQDGLLQLNLETDDELFVSLAGLKQVKDILNGKLKFTQGLIEPDEININDDHYSQGAESFTQDNQSESIFHSTNNNSNSDAPMRSIHESSGAGPDNHSKDSRVSDSSQQPTTVSLGTEGAELQDKASVIGQRSVRVNPFNTNEVKEGEFLSGGLDEEDKENGNIKCNSHPLFDS